MTGKALKFTPTSFLELVPDRSVNDQRPVLTNVFSGMPNEGVPEEKMYQPLIDAINDSGVCPGFVAAQCESKKDPGDPSKQSVDVCLFREADATVDRQPHWSQQVTHFEIKRHSTQQDPFEDSGHDFEAVQSLRRLRVRGQIASYASKLFQYQHIKFCFTVVIFGHKARICRWDRSGVIVTEAFDYLTTTWLAEFLWRLAHLSLEERGCDLSATRLDIANSPEAQMMRQYAEPVDGEVCPHVRRFFRESLDENWPWWKLSIDVNVEKEDEGGRKTTEVDHRGEYLVGKPRFKADGVVGRGTRGYVALDFATKRFVWLKDAWRVDHDGISQEGLILEEIHEHEVDNVPTLLRHGDILSQRTVTQDYWKPPPAHPNMMCPLKTHRHYRMIVKEVCLPLDQFRNGKELVGIILDCLEVHQTVFLRTGRLHRDISATNIMIYVYEKENPKTKKKTSIRVGMLCDWELSKKIPAGKSKLSRPRQPDRTGTWQYLSVNALDDPYRVIAIPDELESILHVLINHGTRFIPHNLVDVGGFIFAYFDDFSHTNAGDICGDYKRAVLQTGKITYSNEDLKFEFSKASPSDTSAQKNESLHPMNTVLSRCLQWFKGYYGLQKTKAALQASDSLAAQSDDEDESMSLRLKRPRKVLDMKSVHQKSTNAESVVRAADEEMASMVQTHDAMISLLVEQLTSSVWPTDDKTDDQLPEDYNHYRAAQMGVGSSKRSLSIFEGEASGSGSNKRSRTAGPSSLQERT